jgi:hypothetical protein
VNCGFFRLAGAFRAEVSVAGRDWGRLRRPFLRIFARGAVGGSEDQVG